MDKNLLKWKLFKRLTEILSAVNNTRAYYLNGELKYTSILDVSGTEEIALVYDDYIKIGGTVIHCPSDTGAAKVAFMDLQSSLKVAREKLECDDLKHQIERLNKVRLHK